MTAEKSKEPAGYLLVNAGTPDAYHFKLDYGEVLQIGRKSGSDAGPRKLVLSDPEVSNLHSELRPRLGGWTICDLKSTNGTRLNGNWLLSGQEYLLTNGDHIQVAQISLVVKLPDSALRTDPKDSEEQARRHLPGKTILATVLVAEIRTLSSLCEKYSVAPVTEAADKVFSQLHDEIQRNHGRVLKMAGDGVSAYWQSDSFPNLLKEADKTWVYQACGAALKLRETVQQISGGLDWPFADHPFQVGITMVTGHVVYEGWGSLAGVVLAKSGIEVLGDTALLAAQINGAMSRWDNPNDTFVESLTHEIACNKFNFERLGSQVVAGHPMPVELFRLLSLKS